MVKALSKSAHCHISSAVVKKLPIQQPPGELHSGAGVVLVVW
jgi:hypothetical protein